jgi:hypothetical protein
MEALVEEAPAIIQHGPYDLPTEGGGEVVPFLFHCLIFHNHIQIPDLLEVVAPVTEEYR